MSNHLPDGYRWVKWRVGKLNGTWVYFNVNDPLCTRFTADTWEEAFKNACRCSRYNWTVNVESAGKDFNSAD